MTDKCTDCIYNRPMKAFGEVVEACHYTLETGKELYGKTDDEEYCSGKEDASHDRTTNA